MYFSIGEQISIRNVLFPQFRNENVAESRNREVYLGPSSMNLAIQEHSAYNDVLSPPNKDKKK